MSTSRNAMPSRVFITAFFHLHVRGVPISYLQIYTFLSPVPRGIIPIKHILISAMEHDMYFRCNQTPTSLIVVNALTAYSPD